MSPEEIKHLEFIQNVITRMNANSFSLKGWAITISSATIGIFLSTKLKEFFLIGIFASVLFWFLDAFYLHQEKKYRSLYNDAKQEAKENEPKIIQTFNMDASNYKKGFCEYIIVVFSKTLVPLYISIIIILLIAYYKLDIK